MRRNRREERRFDEREAPPRRRLGPLEARALFEAVTDYRVRRYRFFDEALAPAMPAWSDFTEEYARYRRFASASPFARGEESPWADLWTFYALSRLFEWLIIGVQVGAELGGDLRAGPKKSPTLSRDELVGFFGAFGMEPMVLHARHHPFFHEIVGVERDATLGDAVLVEEEVWPGLWFGDLVFARAGVSVRCGPDAPLDPAIAVRSTLYFAWKRARRPTYDLSHGWGSNSQWATRFRRDYADGAMLRYNVDGRVQLAVGAVVPHPDGYDPGSRSGLTPAERVELLIHRCAVRTAEPGDSYWPFDDSYIGPAPAPDWTW